MQVSNISHVNSFAEALAILRCWFLTFTNMLVLTKQQGSSACNLDAYVGVLRNEVSKRYACLEK